MMMSDLAKPPDGQVLAPVTVTDMHPEQMRYGLSRQTQWPRLGPIKQLDKGRDLGDMNSHEYLRLRHLKKEVILGELPLTYSLLLYLLFYFLILSPSCL
jgi:hypothetical protein